MASAVPTPTLFFIIEHFMPGVLHRFDLISVLGEGGAYLRHATIISPLKLHPCGRMRNCTAVQGLHRARSRWPEHKSECPELLGCLVSYGPLAQRTKQWPGRRGDNGADHTQTQSESTCSPRKQERAARTPAGSSRQTANRGRWPAPRPPPDASPLETTSAWRQTRACCVDVRVLYTSKTGPPVLVDLPRGDDAVLVVDLDAPARDLRAAALAGRRAVLARGAASSSPSASSVSRVFEQFRELAPRLGQGQRGRLRAARGRRASCKGCPAPRLHWGLHTGAAQRGSNRLPEAAVAGTNGIVQNV